MSWDYEAHRAKLYEACKGTIRPPWDPLTDRDREVIAYRKRQREEWANHAAWEDFSLGWKFLGYAVNDPDWLWDYIHQDEAWCHSFRAAANWEKVMGVRNGHGPR